LGEQIANELVEWFNQVDATYRSDLRDMNEQNFARFDAKLEQRLAELRSELEKRLAELRSELSDRITRLEARVDVSAAEVRALIAQGQREQMRFLYLASAVQLAAIIGLYAR
jgi:hypothetical protein